MRDDMPPLSGYLDRFSHRPGETFSAFVSARDPGPCRARLVRLVGPAVEGRGPEVEDLGRLYDHRFPAISQPLRRGSYARAPSPARDPHVACSWTILVWSDVPAEPRAVFAEEDAVSSMILLVGAEGVTARLAWPGGGCQLQSFRRFQPRCWHRIWLAADPATGRLRLGQAAFDDAPAAIAEAQTHGQTVRLPSGSTTGGGTVLFAAEGARTPRAGFAGKLEAPAILLGFQAFWSDPATLLAEWDFARGIDGFGLADVGPQARHGVLLNAPLRGVAGSGWTGREMCWRHAPQDYAAIRFSAGDLDDCQWARSFTWVVPRNLRSGVYAMRVTGAANDGAAAEAWLPLCVLPRREASPARLALLVPSFTYQAGADGGEAPRSRFFSRRRPLPLSPVLGGLAEDLPLLGWLGRLGERFDVLTDEDLDDAGPELLAPYRCVLTGARPQCQTERTLDALELLVRGGGRLIYAGGGGFTRRVARRHDLPHLIERRLTAADESCCAAEAGEGFHQLDGQIGGPWRLSRRPPQRLVGIGAARSQPRDAGGLVWRRAAASYAPQHAWVFAGVEEASFAEPEIPGEDVRAVDASAGAHGTPENAIVLASAAGAEMVMFETRAGGAVFAIGSSQFGAGLGDGGPAARVLSNVVHRFVGT